MTNLFNTLVYSFTINNTLTKKITLKTNNHITLLGEINKESINKAINDISRISSNSNFYIYIDSFGGSVDDGERLIDVMNYYQANGQNITCIAQNALSMAFYIFQNCNYRMITPSGKLMQHQITVTLHNQVSNSLNYLKMIERIEIKINTFCALRIGKTYQKFIYLITNDWWIYGKDNLHENTADEIVLVGCDKSLVNGLNKKSCLLN